ncbi:sulfatase [Vibrio agarivorans]|uniref:Sulfatase n=1 Tax=Vibrio agarivorans TaxID=153622 RepID=A0ABT7XZH7_9VIBR|nr:sulfatase [Vibrio agarivorans]MDN2481171.1 sulfatase [Vibrio agarivorans]
MSRSQLSVLVKHQEHCNIDSFPLRFGFTFDEDMECTVLLESKGRQDHRYEDRTLYEGVLIHPLTDDRFYGTYVIANNNASNVLITAWRNDIDTEYYLSAVMKMLRKSGVLTTQDLLNFHPRYESKQLNSHADLVLALSENKSSHEVSRIQQDASQAIMDAQSRIHELELKNQKLEMEVTNLQQKSEIKDLLHEVRLTQATANSASYHFNHVTHEKKPFGKGISAALAALCVGIGGIVTYQAMSGGTVGDIAPKTSTPPSSALTPDIALRFVDEYATVCGTVVQITDFAKGSYLNFDRTFPNTQFTAVIWNSDFKHVTQDQSLYTTYSNKNVCVSGKVSSYNDRAQIVLKNPKQISVY